MDDIPVFFARCEEELHESMCLENIAGRGGGLSQQQPSSPESSLKRDFLQEAEDLLLETDETLGDLLDYIGLYLLFMFIAMVMSLVSMMYFFVESFVRADEPRWKNLLTSVIYSVIFIYLNSTADHFNYQVMCYRCCWYNYDVNGCIGGADSDIKWY